MFQRHDYVLTPTGTRAPLYVVVPVFNAIRWRSRWKLLADFVKRCDEAGAIPYVVEVAFGDRAFAVTDPTNPRHVQLRTNSELWLKERAINIGVSRLPHDWKYVAWVDGDVTFVRDDWADETIHQLQHYAIVQMFSEAMDLTSDHEFLAAYRSFGDSFVKGIPWETGKPLTPKTYYGGGTPAGTPNRGIWKYRHHPGYGWAARRDAFDALGGLFDVAVIGEADYIMARALAGAGLSAVKPGVSPGYKAAILEWQARADRSIRRNLGCVPGLLLHHWHGPKVKRVYWERTELLIETQFDPAVDIKPDWQGLYQLTGRSLRLRDGLRSYFRQRDEDAPTSKE